MEPPSNICRRKDNWWGNRKNKQWSGYQDKSGTQQVFKQHHEICSCRMLVHWKAVQRLRGTRLAESDWQNLTDRNFWKPNKSKCKKECTWEGLNTCTGDHLEGRFAEQNLEVLTDRICHQYVLAFCVRHKEELCRQTKESESCPRFYTRETTTGVMCSHRTWAAPYKNTWTSYRPSSTGYPVCHGWTWQAKGNWKSWTESGVSVKPWR